MTYQRQPHQPEGALGPPIQSGSMYIGLCQTRAQAAALRWQYAVVFMALNGVVASLCFQLMQPETYGKILAISGISFIMVITNFLFRGLVDRSNQWIDHFTVAIENIENAVGTESGVRVFSDPHYLSKEATQSLVRGFRFRNGIRALSHGGIALWAIICLGSMVWGTYLAGLASQPTNW